MMIVMGDRDRGRLRVAMGMQAGRSSGANPGYVRLAYSRIHMVIVHRTRGPSRSRAADPANSSRVSRYSGGTWADREVGRVSMSRGRRRRGRGRRVDGEEGV